MNNSYSFRYRNFIIAIIFSAFTGCATCPKNPSQVIRGGKYDGCNLSNMDLSGQDYSNTSFRNAYINHSDLSNANFEKADLRGITIKQSNLIDSNLRDAQLGGAKLLFNNMQGTDLKDATGSKVEFTGSSLDNAIWVSGRVCTTNSTGYCNKQKTYKKIDKMENVSNER